MAFAAAIAPYRCCCCCSLQSVKVGCAEGGCGACAVEVLQHDAATGEHHHHLYASQQLPMSCDSSAVTLSARSKLPNASLLQVQTHCKCHTHK
jgi:xanthine dehydrogenase iron-sulfur cluster and FAD-binding subunit A